MPSGFGLRQELAYFKRVRDYGSAETARLIQRNLPNIVAPLRPEGGKIRCDELDLTLDPARHGFFLEGMRCVEAMLRAGVGRFVVAEDGAVEFQGRGVRLVPETAQELFILDEIFRSGVYDLDAPGEWLAWDVGMNVGMASAFFAGTKGWETVGYEPFPEPFAAARANVARSGLEGRVHLVPKGVSDRGQTLRLAYDRSARGSNGLYGNNAPHWAGETVEAEVAFEDAATVVAGSSSGRRGGASWRRSTAKARSTPSCAAFGRRACCRS